MKHILLILFFVFSFKGFSQTVDTTVYAVVEEMPEYPGGQAALMNYLMNSVQINDAEKNCFTSKVFISFVIDEKGKPIKPIITTKHHADCSIEQFEKHLKSVVLNMPDWKPGKQNGKAVKVRYNLPMTICYK